MSESENVKRVRNLTNYGTDIISTSEMETLVETAKDEVKADISDPELTFDTPESKSALMWILCIFCKIHVGEIGADGYAIGEIETKDLDSQGTMWFEQYRHKRVRLLGPGMIRHVKPSRSSRSYGASGDTSYGGN